MYIYPYKPASESAKILSESLGSARVKHNNSRFKGNPSKVVINWGSSELPEEVMKCKVINSPESVLKASNKLKFFNAIEDYNNQYGYDMDEVINVPQFTTSYRTASYWSNLEESIVVARHKLTGNSGEGIELINPLEGDIPRAPLYVKYIPKKQEYRVHVANGQVVDLQRKARRRDVEDNAVNWRIRNHANGFIFARNELEVPDGVERQAVLACRALGLDFGAVDIIFNDKSKTAYVLEINTAPGLTGQTLDGYVERFKNWSFDEKVEEEEPVKDEVGFNATVQPIITGEYF